jgi:hypothetical protein
MGKVLVCWCAPLACHAEKFSLTDFLDWCRISDIALVSKGMIPTFYRLVGIGEPVLFY